MTRFQSAMAIMQATQHEALDDKTQAHALSKVHDMAYSTNKASLVA